MIIGLTGKFAAGKGTVADLLVEQGYIYHSLSDILREELAARGIPEGRETLMNLGNQLRREGGPGVLATRLLSRLQDGRDHIVDSIRNPVEVEELRRLEAFVLVGIDAEQRLRFDRLRARQRVGDPEDWEEFQRLEAAETASSDPAKQQLAGTFALRDHTIQNDGSTAELGDELARLLKTLGLGAEA